MENENAEGVVGEYTTQCGGVLVIHAKSLPHLRAHPEVTRDLLVDSISRVVFPTVIDILFFLFTFFYIQYLQFHICSSIFHNIFFHSKYFPYFTFYITACFTISPPFTFFFYILLVFSLFHFPSYLLFQVLFHIHHLHSIHLFCLF